jgi:hypothetical protein
VQRVRVLCQEMHSIKSKEREKKGIRCKKKIIIKIIITNTKSRWWIKQFHPSISNTPIIITSLCSIKFTSSVVKIRTSCKLKCTWRLIKLECKSSTTWWLAKLWRFWTANVRIKLQYWKESKED